MKNIKINVSILFVVALFGCVRVKSVNPTTGWENLLIEIDTIGKSEWRPMLKYVADLHEKSTHPAHWPFDYEWEEIGPGYVYGPAFGHWDIVHQVMDVLPAYPEHGKILQRNLS